MHLVATADAPVAPGVDVAQWNCNTEFTFEHRGHNLNKLKVHSSTHRKLRRLLDLIFLSFFLLSFYLICFVFNSK